MEAEMIIGEHLDAAEGGALEVEVEGDGSGVGQEPSERKQDEAGCQTEGGVHGGRVTGLGVGGNHKVAGSDVGFFPEAATRKRCPGVSHKEGRRPCRPRKSDGAAANSDRSFQSCTSHTHPGGTLVPAQIKVVGAIFGSHVGAGRACAKYNFADGCVPKCNLGTRGL
jgi:hypothetical protein